MIEEDFRRLQNIKPFYNFMVKTGEWFIIIKLRCYRALN